jgi:hypothetical protein
MATPKTTTSDSSLPSADVLLFATLHPRGALITAITQFRKLVDRRFVELCHDVHRACRLS